MFRFHFRHFGDALLVFHIISCIQLTGDPQNDFLSYDRIMLAENFLRHKNDEF